MLDFFFLREYMLMRFYSCHGWSWLQTGECHTFLDIINGIFRWVPHLPGHHQRNLRVSATSSWTSSTESSGECHIFLDIIIGIFRWVPYLPKHHQRNLQVSATPPWTSSMESSGEYHTFLEIINEIFLLTLVTWFKNS